MLGEQRLKSYFMNFPIALLFTENHQKPVSAIKESMTELPVHKVPLRLPRAPGKSKAWKLDIDKHETDRQIISFWGQDLRKSRKHIC